MFGVSSKREKQETALRSGLIDHLKLCIQSLIQDPGNKAVSNVSSSSLEPIIGHTDNTNVLCCVLEAIFIHGLKDSFGDKLSSMFLGDPDRMPVPNFWPVIMVISHRDLMEQISSLPFIVSDVGRGRAWLRLALNQGQLMSYLAVLTSDKDTLKEYYKPLSFLRDCESCDIMNRVLQPLLRITFNLATNAAILNTWTQTPLILSGTWIPTNYEQSIVPVMCATDVASTFQESSEDLGIPIPQTPISDQMFDLIMGSTPETKFINDSYNEVNIPSPVKISIHKRPLKINVVDQLENLNTNLSIHQDEDCQASNTNSDNFTDVVTSINTESNNDTLLSPKTEENDEIAASGSVQTDMGSLLTRSISNAPDSEEYKNLFSLWEESENTDNLPSFLKVDEILSQNINRRNRNVDQQSPLSDEINNFEVLSLKYPTEEDIAKYSPLMGILSNEIGLDAQNYRCYGEGCGRNIGMIYGKARVCHYDGMNYCCECHEGEMSIIPAKIIHNWDFKAYPVCKANKMWLDAIHMHPCIDIRLASPKLYKYVTNLSELQDLEQFYQGKLVPVIIKAVNMGKTHILKCSNCSVRGFICEVCKKNQIIYPFQLEDTFTCAKCSGVYHNGCVKNQEQCVKCKRTEIRKKKIDEEDDL